MFDLKLLALAGLPTALAYTLADGVGRVPAMGWNSWNAYHCEVNETKVLDAAHYMQSLGLQAAGYEYVNLDDCWSEKAGRDNTTHQIVPDYQKFPNGISGLADRLHNMSFKAGIYSSAGFLTCAGYPASLEYEIVDAQTFAAWGIDYLKYDNCYVPAYWNDTCYACNPDPDFSDNTVNGTCTNMTETKLEPLCNYAWPVDGKLYNETYTGLRYRIMGEALAMQNRTILYSLCEWGMDEPWTWGNATAQSWRMSNDINDTWGSVTRIMNLNSFLSNYADFGGHNDPDLLEIGNGGLTLAEERTHFGMWALMKAPLLIGTNLANISQADTEILLNKYLIAFNQDQYYGKPAAPYKWGLNPDWTYNVSYPAQYWSGASSNGTMVALVNTLNDTQTMVADYWEVPELDSQTSYQVVNVWSGEDMGCQRGSINAQVEAHDTAIYLLSPCTNGTSSSSSNSTMKARAVEF